MNWRQLLLSFLMLSLNVSAQDFHVERLFQKENATVSVYSLKMINTSNDSIIVLHAQEAQFPPFINVYKWEEVKGPKSKLLIHLGKTTDDLNPEKYRATKSLAPQETISIYFSLPSKMDKQVKEVELWFSYLDRKYLDEFKKAEKTNAVDAIKKCKLLKEKHGRVVHRFVSF
ncbi:MAG: hypothetical protein ACKOX3_06365 [Bacteroidota bacterium]